jgi:mannose-6-phosphate isomerase-like protein (cupin superfamily)
MADQHVEIEGREAFVALDGSTIREIARPPLAQNLSLAQATVAPGAETVDHLHRRAEEIYLFVSGSGRMRLGDELIEVGTGSAVVIAPGTAHKLWNTGADRLMLFCCCSPPYTDEDTVLLD